MSKKCKKMKLELEYPSMCGCAQPFGAGLGGAGFGGGGYGYGGAARGGGFMSWFYALLILIVIVLQFGRERNKCITPKVSGECCESTTAVSNFPCDNQLIDNSVLFIIIVFLLVLCGGCFFGVGGAGGAGGYGGGCGY